MRTILVSILMFAFVAVASAAVDPGTSKEDRISEYFAEGVKEYYLGNYEKAAIVLLTGIRQKPEDRQCYDFYLSIGQIKFIKMMEREELAGVLKYILRRANLYRTALRRDPRYINLLITKLESQDQNQRIVAQHELVAIGPVAVPHLIQNLVGEDRKDDLRVICRVTLTKMGYRAVVPLIECLKSNDRRVIESAATSLTDIADERALPRLKAMLDAETDDVVKKVCANAVAGILERAGLADNKTSAQRYYEEGRRYFRDDSSVRDEGQANEYLIWRWHADRQPSLIYIVVPRYAWNELMAEQILLDGMKGYPAYDAYFSLTAAVLEAQWVEAYWRDRLMKDRTLPPEHPDEEVANIALRLKALNLDDADPAMGRPEIEDRVIAVGAVNLYRAITQAIAAERYDVARRLMHHLTDRYLSQAEAMLPSKEEGLTTGKPGTTLVSALQHFEKTIRYEAAITLATLDPKLEFFNAEAVIPLLSEAVTEWGMRVVLVVEPDYRERNAARKALQDKNFLVITAADGFEAMARLRESPIKDAVIIAGDLTPFLKDSQNQLLKVDEQDAAGMIRLLRGLPAEKTEVEKDLIGEAAEPVRRPAYINEKAPIFISLPEDQGLAVEIQNALDGKCDGFVRRPYQSAQLAIAIDAKIGDAALPVLNAQVREELSLAAAQALLAIDPNKTQYPLAQAADALVRNAILNRSDAIKATSLLALGRTGRVDLINKVTDAWTQYRDQLAGPDKAKVRQAFVNCIGMLDPTTEPALAILKEAVSDADRDVRREAFLALGRGKGIPNTILLQFLEEKRLDVLNPGAGPDSATAPVEGANVPAEEEAAAPAAAPEE